MLKFKNQFVLYLFMIPTVISVFQTSSLAASWKTETIDEQKTFGDMSPKYIAIDGAKTYLVYGEDHLYLSTIDGEQNQIEIIDDTSGVGDHVSLALANGNLYVSYYDTVNQDLKYATNASGSWVVTTIDSPGQVGEYTSIAVGSSGKVHIVYQERTVAETHNIKYAHNVDGDWTVSTIVAGRYPSIVLDPTENAHIVFYDDVNKKLKYGTNKTSSWVFEIVDSASPNSQPSLVLDSNQKVHISYDDGDDEAIKYATNANGPWLNSIILSGPEESSTSIALDGSDKPYIVFTNENDNGLYVANRVTGAWNISLTIDVGNGVESVSVAFDSSDELHIGYKLNEYTSDASTQSLKLAVGSNGNWDKQVVATEVETGGHTSINSDSLGNLHISFFDETNDDSKYATNKTGKWVVETVDAIGSTGQYTSLSLDQNDFVHISYYNETDGNLLYATNATGSWVVTTVDNDIRVGQLSSLAVDSANKVHIAYRDNTNSTVKYATNKTGVWTLDIVDAGYSNHISLKIDKDDFVHIGYSVGNDIKVANNISGTWVSDIVESNGVGFVSIAIDDENQDHVVYYGSGNAELKYATKISGSGWQIETIDSDATSSIVTSTSIAIDSKTGNVHVAYRDETGFDLKYATKGQNGWDLQTIDSYGDVGSYADILINSLGNIFISYTDGTNDDLKLASYYVSEQLCQDGADDDGDGQIDCADADCANTPACQNAGTGTGSDTGNENNDGGGDPSDDGPKGGNELGGSSGGCSLRI